MTSSICYDKEYLNGNVTHTRTPHLRLPVEDYLKKQGRFAQLLTPQRDETTLRDIRSRIDAYWQELSGTS